MAIAAGGDHSLALIGRPMIESAPVSRTVTVGSTVEFRAKVSGAAPFAYQWCFNATNFIPGATNGTLQLTDLQLPQSGGYSVLVTNAYGSVTSPPAMLLVTDVPVIVVSPTNQKS